MIKYSFCLMFCILCAVSTSFCQRPRIDFSDSEAICEHLANIAWQNYPKRKINEVDFKQIEKEISGTNFSMFEGLSVGSNLNEFTFTGNERSDFFPKYIVSYRLSLGQIVDNSVNRKSLSMELDKLLQQGLMEERALRTEVYRKFFDLKLADKLLSLTSDQFDIAENQLTKTEQDFTRGEVDLTGYNEVLDQYRRVEEEKLRSEHAYSIAKANLEELIGDSLANALSSRN